MKKTRNLFVLYAIALLQGMVFYAPVATLYRQARGVSLFEITLIESISLALCLLLEVPWGWLADRIGYRRTMIGCCMLYAVSKAVFWQADGFGGFLAERVLLAVVIAGLSGVDTAMLYLSAGPDSHRAFSIYGALQTTGLIAAGAAYSLFFSHSDSTAALATVFSYLAAAVLALFLQEVHPPRRTRHSFGAALRQAVQPCMLGLLAAAALLAETNQTVTVFLAAPQYLRCGISTAWMGILAGLVTVAGLCGALSPRLCRAMGEKRAALLLCGAAALCCGVLAVSAHPLTAVAAVVGLRAAAGLFAPLQAELQNRHISAEDRASALSLQAMLLDGVGIGTNLVFGYAAEQGLPLAFGLGCTFCLAAAGILAAGAKTIFIKAAQNS